jgi:hypothetical protein
MRCHPGLGLIAEDLCQMTRESDYSEESLSPRWRGAFHFLVFALIPSLAVLMFFLAIAIISAGSQGDRSFDLLTGVTLAGSLMAVAFWVLERRKWYASWRKYVLVTVGSIPVALATLGTMAVGFLIVLALLGA